MVDANVSVEVSEDEERLFLRQASDGLSKIVIELVLALGGEGGGGGAQCGGVGTDEICRPGCCVQLKDKKSLASFCGGNNTVERLVSDRKTNSVLPGFLWRFALPGEGELFFSHGTGSRKSSIL